MPASQSRQSAIVLNDNFGKYPKLKSIEDGFLQEKPRDDITAEDITTRRATPVRNGKPRPAEIEGIDVNQLYFPTTRYYGSKRRLLSWLAPVLQQIEFDSVLDAFGGTATMSLLLLQLGKEVTFHDGFRFNYLTGRALLRSGAPSISRTKFKSLIDRIEPQEGFISKTFEGLFYTTQENNWLDGVLAELPKIQPRATRDLLLYCLFQACLKKRPFNLFHRANLYLRENRHVKRRFGNQTTWDKDFEEHTLAAYDDASRVRTQLAKSAKLISPTKILDLPTGYDLIYLDPPYLGAHRSPERYISRYHFLEGLSRSREWPSLIDKDNSIGCLRQNYFQEDWEDKRQFVSLLSAMLRRHRRSVVALSYVEGGTPSIQKLENVFAEVFPNVRVYKEPITYALSRASSVEILIVGSPK